MNVLILAPHPDDEAIGCGGTIIHHVEQGDKVSAVFLTSGELGLKKYSRERAWQIREAEAQRSAKVLGIRSVTFLRQPDWMLGDHLPAAAKALSAVMEQERPEIIYLPHPDDGHPDHQACLPMLKRALKRTGLGTVELRGYEVWTPLTRYDLAQDITQFMPRKLRALRCHRSQLTDYNYVQAVRGLNAYRGALTAKCAYAEVFQRLSLA
jgi:LmbE family N-acetylglucosaminyl deacetylase